MVGATGPIATATLVTLLLCFFAFCTRFPALMRLMGSLGQMVAHMSGNGVLNQSEPAAPVSPTPGLVWPCRHRHGRRRGRLANPATRN